VNSKYKRLTSRERALVVNLSKGMSLSDAAIASGYSENNARQSGYQAFQVVKEKMPEILEKHGLTDSAVIDKYLLPAMEACETKFFQKDGFVTDQRDVIAWGPRLTALDTFYKLRGAYVSADKQDGESIRASITIRLDVPRPTAVLGPQVPELPESEHAS
jgi:hypothetical protein